MVRYAYPHISGLLSAACGGNRYNMDLLDESARAGQRRVEELVPCLPIRICKINVTLFRHERKDMKHAWGQSFTILGTAWQ